MHFVGVEYRKEYRRWKSLFIEVIFGIFLESILESFSESLLKSVLILFEFFLMYL